MTTNYTPKIPSNDKPIIEYIESLGQDEREQFFYKLFEVICRYCYRTDCSGYCEKDE